MFVVSLSYKVELDKVREHLEPHLQFLDKYYALGKFIASGPKVPSTGGVILVNACTKEQIEKIVTEDPFYIEGLADYTIVEFNPTKVANGYEGLRVISSAG